MRWRRAPYQVRIWKSDSVLVIVVLQTTPSASCWVHPFLPIKLGIVTEFMGQSIGQIICLRSWDDEPLEYKTGSIWTSSSPTSIVSIVIALAFRSRCSEVRDLHQMDISVQWMPSAFLNQQCPLFALPVIRLCVVHSSDMWMMSVAASHCSL